MGWFSKVKKFVKKPGTLIGGAMGAAGFGALGAIGGGLLGGKVSDKIFKGGPSPDELEIEKAKALRGRVLDTLSGQLESAGKGLSPVEQAQLATQAGQRSLSDTERQGLRTVQQGVARRGIAGLTSVGLGAGAQVQQDIGRQRMALAANQPFLQEQARQAQRQEIQGAAQAALGSGFLPEFAGKKKSLFQKAAGPVFGGIGAGIGGLFGGAAGAKAGGTVGLSAGRAFS